MVGRRYLGIMTVALAGQFARIDARRTAAAVTAVLLVLAALIGAYAVNNTAGLRPGPNEYNVAAWEVRNFPGKWIFLAGQLLNGAPSEAEQDQTLRRFFELNARIESLGNENSNAASRGRAVDAGAAVELAALLDERDAIENQVEATLESRLTQVIEDEGLTRDLIIDDAVWPPVDAEFTEAPRALARSPRDRIELLGSTLLEEDLTIAEAEAIEQQVARDQGVSALSFGTGGIGAYPTIIDYPDGYRRALEVIAHEWMHNYLFFRPLGFNYYDDNDLRTMNETVADLVGRELAERALERWPLDPPAGGPATETPPPEREKLAGQLRSLRGEVDALLAAGRIDEAEALMEQRRQELAAQGHFIRKINQAYFAYLNLYAGEAGSAAATNPIGPKVDELRRRTASLGEFVDIIGNITSIAELDEVLSRLP
jgi:hypothetical protein